MARVVDEPLGPRGRAVRKSRRRSDRRDRLTEPATGIAPGQAAVIYAGTRVVGSATIARTGRRTPA